MTILAVRNSGAEHVFILGHRFQVVRVYAWFVSAQVINLQSIWNFSFMNFVAKAVSKLTTITCDVDLSITVSDGANPFPARVERNFFNLSPEPFFGSSHMGTIP